MDSKDKARAKRLLDCFGLTIEQWETINDYQQKVCWFCHKAQKSGKRLALDHRHADGLSRGLLCSTCNRTLGRVEGAGWTAETLLRVIQYLQDPPAVRALGVAVYGFPGRVGTKRHRKWIKKEKEKK